MQAEVKRVRQEMERLAGTVAELKAEVAGKAQELVLAVRENAELQGQVCLISIHQMSGRTSPFSLESIGQVWTLDSTIGCEIKWDQYSRPACCQGTIGWPMVDTRTAILECRASTCPPYHPQVGTLLGENDRDGRCELYEALTGASPPNDSPLRITPAALPRIAGQGRCRL